MNLSSKVHIEISGKFSDSAKFPFHDISIKPSIIKEIENYLTEKGVNFTPYLNINDENIQGKISMEVLREDYELRNIESVIFEGNYNGKKLIIGIRSQEINPHSLPSDFIRDYDFQKKFIVSINVSGKEMNGLDEIYEMGEEILEILYRNSYTSRGKVIGYEKDIEELKKLVKRRKY